MSARKQRVRLVLDTNVFVRNFKARGKSSPNRRIIQLWLFEKKLQLIVSQEIVDEYLEIFEAILEFEPHVFSEWQERFSDDPRVTALNLGRRDFECRDPEDNVFLSTARAEKAKYLVTNDRDLLDQPFSVRNVLPFVVTTPYEFLRIMAG